MKMIGFLIFSIVLSACSAATPSVKVENKEGFGRYLADAKGMTLYYFRKDPAGVSSCSGDCLRQWHVFHIRRAKELPEEVDAYDLGVITRGDGLKQSTYRKMPLYYFVKDRNPGDTFGQGISNAWFMIPPTTFIP